MKFCGILLLGIASTSATVALAQQATVGTPNNQVTDSFFERQGTNFGFNLGGGMMPPPGASGVVGIAPNGALTPAIPFRQGGFNGAVPPAGGFNPGTGANAGMAIGGGPGMGFFGMDFGQGSTRTNSVVAPSVTMMNGGMGSISSGIQRPFVTGVTPVVGGFGPGFGPPMASPSILADRLQRAHEAGGLPGAPREEKAVQRSRATRPPALNESTAGQHAPSVAAIRAEQAAAANAGQAEAQMWFDRAAAAEAAGKSALAKAYYRNASNQATGQLREQALSKLQELQSSSRR